MDARHSHRGGEKHPIQDRFCPGYAGYYSQGEHNASRRRKISPWRLLAILCLSFSSLALFAQDKKPVVYELGPSMLERLLLNDADHLTFVAGAVRQKLRYRIEGLKLMAQNIETGDYIQLGFFSKDGAKVTLINGYILDRKK